MIEFIKAGNTTYECTNIQTTPETITFTILNQPSADSMALAFKDVEELTVSDGEGNEYGHYENLAFSGATNTGDGNVTVTMRMKSDMEIRLERLESGQEVQDGAIRELAEIVGGE